MSATNPSAETWYKANGKVILFGEHAVVYGVQAIAAGIADGMRARVQSRAFEPTTFSIPKWALTVQLGQPPQADDLLHRILQYLVEALDINESTFQLELEPNIPHASGMGASAAVAVASIRALAGYFNRSLSENEVNQLAYGCEKLAHGSPSGLDNTLATFGGLLRYRRSDQGAQFEPIQLAQPLKLVVGLSGKKGYTAATVKRVAEAKEANPKRYQSLFDDIATISQQAERALMQGDFPAIAELMNQNQECLRQMQVSCNEIETLISTANRAGALGAKLTGSGDGGAVIIFAGERESSVRTALQKAGFASLTIELSSAQNKH